MSKRACANNKGADQSAPYSFSRKYYSFTFYMYMLDFNTIAKQTGWSDTPKFLASRLKNLSSFSTQNEAQ